MKAPEPQFTPRTLVPQGNHLAICYEMIEVGTVEEDYMGQSKILPKVRITWELPHETIEVDGVQKPMAISNEYTFSMGDRATLRRDLESWRGAKFTEEQARDFDIERLLGHPCLLNVIHKTSQTSGKTYEQISAVTPPTKGMSIPKLQNAISVLSYEKFDVEKFEALPDFIKNKMKTSQEYKERVAPILTQAEKAGLSQEPIGGAKEMTSDPIQGEEPTEKLPF